MPLPHGPGDHADGGLVSPGGDAVQCARPVPHRARHVHTRLHQSLQDLRPVSTPQQHAQGGFKVVPRAVHLLRSQQSDQRGVAFVARRTQQDGPALANASHDRRRGHQRLQSPQMFSVHGQICPSHHGRRPRCGRQAVSGRAHSGVFPSLSSPLMSAPSSISRGMLVAPECSRAT